MLIMVMGRYRAGDLFTEPEAAAKLNEELSSDKIRLAGQLRDREGVVGFAVVLAGEGLDDGELYLRETNYFRTDLFDEITMLELRPEVGAVE